MSGRSYPAPIRTTAVQMVTDRIPTSRSEWAAIETVAAHFGVHANTVRGWVRAARGTAAPRPLMLSEQDAEIARLRAELAAAQAANAALAQSLIDR